MTTPLLEAFVTPVLINASTGTELVSRVFPFNGCFQVLFQVGTTRAHHVHAFFQVWQWKSWQIQHFWPKRYIFWLDLLVLPFWILEVVLKLFLLFFFLLASFSCFCFDFWVLSYVGSIYTLSNQRGYGSICSIFLIIIRLALRVGQVKRTLCAYWLLKR